MPLLRFTNPTDIAAYRDYDFEVQASEITLRAEDVRDILSAFVEEATRNYHKDWEQYAESIGGRFAHTLKMKRLCVLLSNACIEGNDIVLDDCVSALVSDLMFSRRFVGVLCPICKAEFKPEDCNVIDWVVGEELFTAGKRVTCPSGHTLYSCMELTGIRHKENEGTSS